MLIKKKKKKLTNQYFVDTELHRPSFESLVNYLSISMGFLVIKWE